MCLLNGDLGGNLPASIDFGKIETYTETFSRVVIEDKTQYKANKHYIWDMNEGKYKISLDEYNSNI
jgi:hypothetical protein